MTLPDELEAACESVPPTPCGDCDSCRAAARIRELETHEQALIADNVKQAATNERLEREGEARGRHTDWADAIIDRLPRTADGVPVVPGMEVWLTNENGNVDRMQVNRIHAQNWDRPAWQRFLCNSYSTREAAEAAKGGE